MPEWMHNRAEHILAKNPSMPKSEAFAIATQQSHATGHSPKGFGTAEGRAKAKAKFDTPKGDEHRANPGNLTSSKMAAAAFTHVVSVRTTRDGAGALRDILHNIQQNGAPGHSFGIVTTDKPARHIGSWDGDGADTMALPTMHKMASVVGWLLESTGLLGKLGFASSSYGGQPAQNGPGMRGRSQIPPFVAPPIEVKAAGLRRVGELVTGSRANKLYDAALRHADSARGGSAASAKAVRKLRGLAHMEEGNVGRMQGALATGAGIGAVADLTGFAERRAKAKEAGVGVGAGMSASQYSGPLSYGPFKQESAIPAFISPGMTKTDPRLEAPAYATGGNKTAGAATGAMTAAGRLRASQRLTAPKLTGFSGPSIADIAKPKGFGKPLSGALKGTLG